ncbi:unnamed protein product [Mytilus coruscus]|uniref:MAM domain-containing protein n=1 Tax=Mytilus coruscus TaxID=42192 RepID=A0A6J8CUZ6_MYTCO|nr:unnamed protein product [Mytilus coruscus]
MVETCPTKYLDMQNVSLSFEPEKEICLEYKIKERFLHNCTISEDEKSCELNLSSYVQRYPECFRPNEIQIQYKCEGIVNGSCTFENDQCGWSVSSNGTYQWIHRRGQTPESSTGPDRDHTTASETAVNRELSDTAVFSISCRLLKVHHIEKWK